MVHKYSNPIIEMTVDILVDYLKTDVEENPFSSDPPENWQADLARDICFELLNAANANTSTKLDLWRSM